MLRLMYGRRITSPDQVISRIRVTPNPSDVTMHDKFLLAMARYLRGVGHPTGLDDGLVSQDMMTRDAGNTTLRAERFLVLCTASELQPTDVNWELTVNIQFIIHIWAVLTFDLDALREGPSWTSQ